jgi:hypothetical protein
MMSDYSEMLERAKKYKPSFDETDDGREDVMIKVGGQPFLVMPQEGYRAAGMTSDQAKKLMGEFARLFVACGAKDGRANERQ